MICVDDLEKKLLLCLNSLQLSKLPSIWEHVVLHFFPQVYVSRYDLLSEDVQNDIQSDGIQEPKHVEEGTTFKI